MKYLRLYLLNWLLLLDSAVVVLFGFDKRLTISAVAAIYGKEKNCKICKWLCKTLDKIDRRHCSDSIINWTNYRPWDRSLWDLPE